MPNAEFKQLLKEGIDSIANRQNKLVRTIEEEIGQALHVSHHTVQRWKRGYVPNEMERIEFVVKYCRKYGRVDQMWARRFLTQASHPAPEIVIERIFPKAADPANKRKLPGVRDNLPPRYGEFIGREAEVARVLEWIENARWPLASIEGMGGIGKTSLAIEVAHRCLPGEQLAIDKPFDAVVWTSARDQADFDLSLEDVLDDVAYVLDYAYLVQQPTEQKIKSIDKLLRNNRTLVIVDNFETITDLALVKFLEQMPEPSLALITSRYKQLRRIWDIPLYGLKDEEILTLIRRHSHRIGLTIVAGADDDTLSRLAAATGNNPKAVELSLGLIKQKGLPFNSVVDELYQASQMVEEVFDYIFIEAWKLLDQKTQRVLLTMPLFVATANREALSVVSGVVDFDFHKAIEQLVGMSLLGATEALDISQQRYSLHPLTQAFARHQLGVDMVFNPIAPDQPESIRQIAELKTNFHNYFAEEWSRKKVGPSFWDFVSWNVAKYEEISSELPNLMLSMEWAYENKDWPDVLALAKVIVHPIYYHGQLEKRIKCSKYGLFAARKLNIVEDEMWFAIQGLGSIYLLRGDYERVKKYIKLGLKLARRHEVPDAVALGETYLGYLDLQQGNVEQAQQHIDIALESAHGALFQYRAYHAAGHVARQRKNYEQARDFYFKSAEFLDETSILDTSDVWLGFTKLGQGKYNKAERYFRRYLEKHAGHGNQRVVGMAKFGLARYHEIQGNLAEALDLANQAFELLSAINAQWELKQVTELLERLAEGENI